MVGVEGNLTVIIDYREERSGITEILQKLEVPFELVNIEVGDYVIGEIAISRKAIGDYLSSKTSGHLDDELYNLSTNYPLSYLIIEGIVSTELLHRKMHRQQYIASLIGSSFKRSPDNKQGQIITVNVETIWDTGLALKYLHENAINPECRLPKITRAIPSAEARQIYVLCSIEGIGEVKAKALLKSFKTLSNVFKADVWQLATVKGINSNLASRVHNFINEEYQSAYGEI